MVAQTIHRFWAGREMPKAYRDYGRDWEELNPGWDVLTWDEGIVEVIAERIPELAPVFHSLAERDAGRFGIEYYVQLADVLGYALVEHFGGVYVNCDMQPVRSLAGRLPDKAWASLENNEDGRIVNAAFGAPEAHDRFWLGLIHDLPARYFANPEAEMVETTGPAFLTDYARTRSEQLHVFPVVTFNPFHWKQIESGSDANQLLSVVGVSPETIAVHHWGHKRDGRSNRVETATQ